MLCGGKLDPFRTVAVLASVVLLSAAIPRAHANHDEIRIATNVWPGYEPLYLIGAHAPSDASRPLELVRYWNASEVTSALEIGLVDMAALTLDEAVSSAARGTELVVVAVTDISSGADVICTTTPDAAVRDRVYAHESTALGEYFLYLYLSRNGLALSDVTRVNASVDEHLDLLVAGTADTFLTFNPFASDLVAAGCAPIFDSSQLGPAIIDVLVVRKERYDDRMQGDVAAMMRSFQEIAGRIRAKDAELVPALAAGLGVAGADVYAQYDGLTLPTAAEGEAILAAESFRRLVSGIHGWLVETGRSDLALPDLLDRIEPHGTGR